MAKAAGTREAESTAPVSREGTRDVTNEQPLAGRTALVTGAGRNIGREIALTLARSGADIVVNTRQNRAEADEVVSAVEALGRRAIAVLGDVSDHATVQDMFEQAETQLAPIDILINNAAVRPHQSIFEISPEDWQWVLGVGLTGAFNCTQTAAKGMTERGWGRIINISGRDGFTGIVNRAHGVSVKAGVHGLTKASALELGPHGVTVNTVVPGLIQTTRPEEWYPTLDYEARVAGIPLRRVGAVEDIANMCNFLVVHGGFVTGQALHVNGGEFLVS